MLPCARLRSPDGALHELVHGDLVGRLRSAALHLDDGRVSEAHAMVSLREGELRLISLRGMFAVEGRPQTEVALEEGQELWLARGLKLVVEEVILPDAILGLEGDGLTRQALPAVGSLVLEPEPRLRSGWQEGAALHLWSTGEGWSARAPGGAAQPCAAGDTFSLGGRTFRAVALPLAAAGLDPTRLAGAIASPMRLIARYDSVHIHQDDRLALTVSGVQARLLSELVAFGGPVAWTLLAQELWPGEDGPSTLRRRLDVNLSRLRAKLRGAQLRTDLVRMDGSGMVELVLHPQDAVEDRT